MYGKCGTKKHNNWIASTKTEVGLCVLCVMVLFCVDVNVAVVFVARGAFWSRFEDDSYTETSILGAYAVHKPANTFHRNGMNV